MNADDIVAYESGKAVGDLITASAFWPQVKARVQAGVLFGAQWGVALLVIAFCLSFLLTNYALVSQRAANGQAAFEYIQKAEAAQAARIAQAAKEKPEPQ